MSDHHEQQDHKHEEDLAGTSDAEGPARHAVEVEKASTSDEVHDAGGLQLDGVTESPKSTVRRSPTQTPVAASSATELDLDSHPADALHAPDSPTTSLISALRDQLRLLSDQSQQLNTKLVESISRHADLVDQHEALQSTHRDLGTRADGLAREKKQWEESMKTGLFVERDVIAGEMQRLAAGLVEEERRRGSAEERRRKVEDEVDELAATLFDQANTMVASERHGRIEAEERLKATEDNLAAAEAAMRDMQLHLQSMPVSAGPSSTPPGPAVQTIKRRYLASHLPYTEYSSFLTHLRSLRPLKETSKQIFPPPLVSTLLAQAFLARTILEDHDPTLRLDIAPDLSWLSRRGISSAIISGDLVIEPVSANTVLSQTTTPSYDLGCALCGKPVFPLSIPQSPAASHFGPPPMHPSQRNPSASRFSLKPFFNASSPSTAQSPGMQMQGQSQSPAASPSLQQSLPSVYIFRVARASSATTAADKEKEAKNYPLCRTGWCLERLRATCELWHFVRTGIVQVVWHGDDGFVLPTEIAAAAHTAATSGTAAAPALEGVQAVPPAEASPVVTAAAGGVPPELPRRKSAWGLGFRMSDKPSSGSGSGWAKSWRGSAASSPPVSPRLPSSEEGKVAMATITPVEEKQGGLGAPLELESEKAEIEPSAVVAEEAETVGAEATEVKRSLSPDSVEDAFLTPQQADTALPPHADEVKPDVVSEEKPWLSLDGARTEGEAITLNSPMVSTDLPSRSASPIIAPPPIPRRAAARNRTSIVVEGPSTHASPSASGTATPNVADVPESGAESSAVPVDIPPLPPRHPKTPTMPTPIRTGPVEGDKTHLLEDDDSWEARTWRQVVKLKEEMWRKRLGLSEGDDV